MTVLVQSKDPSSTTPCLQQQLLVYVQRRGEPGQTYWIHFLLTLSEPDYFYLRGFLMYIAVNLVSDSQQICFPSACPAYTSELMQNFSALTTPFSKGFHRFISPKVLFLTGNGKLTTCPARHKTHFAQHLPPHINLRWILSSVLLSLRIIAQNLSKVQFPCEMNKNSTRKQSNIVFINVYIQISSLSILLTASIVQVILLQEQVHTQLTTALYHMMPRWS